ncbi:HSP20-like chaperone [Phytophthora cinnamomi]|uniref:HSP20-like chaperone n=1 Tax=Phytophthora cinnamomi TaxID=4785 RepID=UPI00355A7651|nr:HSP20-like chaperone [Phytophthora cinnamomi]
MGEGFFVPYLYVPSAEATYVKLVTPWGSVHMDKGFLEQLAVSVGVVVLTVMLWRCSARLNARLKKKKDANKTDGDEGEEVDNEEDDDEEEDDEPRSALDESMVKKGENSYYYAHQHREAKDDDESVRKSVVSSYGWSDSKRTVSIYLTDNLVKNMKDEQLVLKWTKTSLSMDLLNAPGGDQAKSLVISALFQEITDVTWKAKKDTLTITLTKAQELPWKSLNGAAKNMEDHIEYDESLYD